MDRVQAAGRVKKRKAENYDNDRLSKRLSLLNLERNGQRLYVPVEQPNIQPTPESPPSSSSKPQGQQKDEDFMQMDDTKHKVYIYDLDAELSDSESDDGKLVFLPDIEKHLRQSRIPPSVLANSEGELAGSKQMVLYNVPSSLSVPEEKDSVRKAIIETRARARAKAAQEREENGRGSPAASIPVDPGSGVRDWYPYHVDGLRNGMMTEQSGALEPLEEEPDAMDLG